MGMKCLNKYNGNLFLPNNDLKFWYLKKQLNHFVLQLSFKLLLSFHFAFSLKKSW